MYGRCHLVCSRITFDVKIPLTFQKPFVQRDERPERVNRLSSLVFLFLCYCRVFIESLFIVSYTVFEPKHSYILAREIQEMSKMEG